MKTEMPLTSEISTTIQAPILDIIASRRSRRAYAATPVTSRQIETLFEAARWAPSGVNEQPWKYIYASRGQGELWSKIFDTLNEGNKIWAKDAPLLIVSMARNTFTRNAHPNATALYDLGGANAFLSLQATAMGLNVHQMGGFDHEALRSNLSIPNGYDLGVVMAIGFPGDPENLPEPFRERERTPRTRQAQLEFVMNQSF